MFHELVQTNDETSGVPDTSKRTHRFLNGPVPDMVLVDEVFNSSGTPTDILWLLQDQQQTVTDVATMSSTSGTATLRNHLEYNAFGDITSQTNSAYAPLQTYTGQILDTTTGLLYCHWASRLPSPSNRGRRDSVTTPRMIIPNMVRVPAGCQRLAKLRNAKR